MKRLLLVLLAALPAGLTAATFSHSVHIKLRLDCTTCHTAARQSTKAEDNLRPPKEICQSCHKDVQIPPPRKTLVVHFSHALHLRMGNVAPFIRAAIDRGNYLQPPGEIRSQLNTSNACEACHRGMENSLRVSMADMPKMADCLVCHTDIDPPFSCETCHAKDVPLKPASHVPGFTNLHSSGKLRLDKSTCAVCHGRTFTCMGCH